jgi:hypothetical protein
MLPPSLLFSHFIISFCAFATAYIDLTMTTITCTVVGEKLNSDESRNTNKVCSLPKSLGLFTGEIFKVVVFHVCLS